MGGPHNPAMGGPFRAAIDTLWGGGGEKDLLLSDKLLQVVIQGLVKLRHLLSPYIICFKSIC